MTEADHEMRDMFFDVAGQPMEAAAFRKRYKTRRPIAVSHLLGLAVGTEFVGINHNAGRGRIKIYETTAYVKSAGVLVCSSWSSSLGWARFTHRYVCVCAWLGAAPWWRLRAWWALRKAAAK